MIASLKGTVVSREKSQLIIDVHDVGYAVFVPISLIEHVHDGEELTLFTYQHVREDTLDLFGFVSRAELHFFKQLIDISGVGPRMALAILSQLSVEQIKTSILQKDPSLLQSVSGVGAKTAERIVIELKDKITLSDDATATSSHDIGSYEEVTETLLSLGYSRSEARRMAQSVPADTRTLEERVKYALKHGSTRR